MLEQYLSQDARNFRPSAIRAFARLIQDPSIISFAGGVPSPATFPADLLAEAAEHVAREGASVSLQYGPTLGLPRLREQVSAICGARGIQCTGADIIITTGSQQALNLVATALLDPGDVVLVELPSYIGGLGSFYARRAELVGVAQDDGGIDVDALRRTVARLQAEGRTVKALYTIPNFQNPSGRLLTQERRDLLLQIAREHGFLVIEDDPYGELVYTEGADTRPIRARADSEPVIYMGSFSKILAPGLRCGWIVAAPTLLRSFELAKESADLCGGMLDQSIIDHFLAAGHLEAQLARVRDFYRDRRATLISSLETEMSSVATWTPAEGGLFTFVTLTTGADTAARLQDAIDAGVAYVPGVPFFVDGSGQSTMRLTFAKEPDDRMREGVRRLARVFGG